jgi:two-component system cell cycle sensor histidine kinase/response regulator CckA
MRNREAEGDNPTILIVEDAEAIRKMVSAMLSQNGFNCLEASDGAEALRLLQVVEDVQLVLTDMIMPIMDGAELARQLTQWRPDMRILFMSGYIEDPVVRALEGSPRLFVPKPFTASVLMEKVRQALDHPWQGIPDGHLGLSP